MLANPLALILFNDTFRWLYVPSVLQFCLKDLCNGVVRAGTACQLIIYMISESVLSARIDGFLIVQVACRAVKERTLRDANELMMTFAPDLYALGPSRTCVALLEMSIKTDESITPPWRLYCSGTVYPWALTGIIVFSIFLLEMQKATWRLQSVPAGWVQVPSAA